MDPNQEYDGEDVRINFQTSDDDGPLGDSMAMDDEARGGVVANPSRQEEMDVEGQINVTCRDKNGKKKWEETVSNLITNEGLDYALAAALSGATQQTTWYLGLVDGATSPTFAAGDTMSGHSGWTENQDYSESNRQTWADGGVSSQSVDNSGSPATVSINASADIAGAFMVSDNTKGGTAGVLFAEGSFGSTRTVANGDTLNVTYTINAN